MGYFGCMGHNHWPLVLRYIGHEIRTFFDLATARIWVEFNLLDISWDKIWLRTDSSIVGRWAPRPEQALLSRAGLLRKYIFQRWPNMSNSITQVRNWRQVLALQSCGSRIRDMCLHSMSHEVGTGTIAHLFLPFCIVRQATKPSETKAVATRPHKIHRHHWGDTLFVPVYLSANC